MPVTHDMTDRIVLAELLGHIADGDCVKITATGQSMRPTFRHERDTLILSPVTAEELAVGDVVLFNRGDAVCVHRIISRNGDRLVIRGDGNGRNALEYARISSVFARVTAGTMWGGIPFKISDAKWRRNTKMIMRTFPAWAAFHAALRIVRSYPLSVLVVAVVTYLSFFDAGNMPATSLAYADKLVHVLMYTGLSGIFWLEWIMVHRRMKKNVKKGMLYCFLMPVLFGGLIELGQEYLTTFRSGDWLDFAANVTGTAIATLFSLFVLSPVIRRISKNSK